MLEKMDSSIIRFVQRISMPLARVAIFVIFFWFGLLKVVGASPATPLVLKLLKSTLPHVDPATFLIFFGLFEMLIAILFLFPRFMRIVMPLFLIHMVTTVMPLFLIPELAWESTFVPTLEGQYMIKNLVLVALAFTIASNMKPMNAE
jgi:uncharacterized membrane protein YkgB